MPIGRTYAGTLGTLAFALMAFAGLSRGAGVEQTILAAAAALFACSAIGYIVGTTAEHLVNESVRTQFQAAMATWDPAHSDHAASASKSTSFQNKH